MIKSIIDGKIVFVKTALNIPILLFVILIIIQYALGRLTHSKLGTIYPYATKVYFFEMASYMLVFLITVNNIRSRRQINRLLGSIISVGAVLALYGIVQKLANAPKIYWFRYVHEVLLFYSSYINCNYFAGYMNIVIFLTLGAFFAYLAYLDKKRAYAGFDLFEGWIILFIFSIVIMAVSILHTFSQGGLIVFLVTSAFFYSVYSKKELSKKWISIAIWVFTTALTVTVLIWIAGEKTANIFYEACRLFKEINTYGARLPVWRGAFNLIKINPLFGIGAGTFQYIFPKYKPNIPISFSHCHNDYLELLIETGLAGLAIFTYGMYIFFKRYMKLLTSRRNAYVKAIGYGCLASAFSVFLYSFIDSNMHIGANALLFSAILAVGLVTIHNSSNGKVGEEDLFKRTVFMIGGRPKKISVFTVTLIAFLYLAANITSIAVADIYAALGKEKRDMEYINKAVRMQPYSAEYRSLLADELLNRGGGRPIDNKTSVEVAKNLEEAVRLNPNVSRYHLKLSLAYARLGDNKKSIEELRKARDLDPLSAFNHLFLAIHCFNESTKIKGVNPYGSKAMEEGAMEYKKARSIDPSIDIDSYKNFLADYPLIKEALKKY